MKKLIIRYGLYSATFLIVTGVITFLALGGSSAGSQEYAKGEVLGYLSIIVSLVFVFFGIKKF